MRHRTVGVLLLAGVISAACASEEPVATSSTGSAPATTATTMPDEISLADLVGEWSNGELVLLVGDDGSYLVSTDPDSPDVMMSGFVARDGDRLNFVTAVGGECSGTTGVYRGRIVEGGLELVLVDDPCEFRSARFEGAWGHSG